MTVYKRTGRTGGGVTDLDGINGDLLLDGDISFVFDGDFLYPYILSASSGAAADGISVVEPILNAGTKRWLLCNSSQRASSYQRFNDGLVIQWGLVTCSATPGNAVVVSFPLAFTTVYRVVTSGMTTNTNNAATWHSDAVTTGFNIRAALPSQGATWIAIGYITPA